MLSRFAIGIDVGGTRTKSGLVNVATGKVIKSIVQPSEKINAAVFLEQVGEIVNEFGVAAEKEGQPVAGIGVGVPGFTTENGIVLTTYGSVEFMENYPITQIIEKAFSLTCLIDNDARTVALGEALYGKGKEYKRVLTITLGTGVGFGFVVDKKFTDAMPLSHMGGNLSISGEGGECYCGKTGCLEALISSSGIINLAKKTGFFTAGALTVESIFSEAENGNIKAVTVINKVCGYLHTAIHNYTNLFAPDMIVLGGGIAKGLAPYLEKIKGRQYMGPYPGYDFELTISELEEQAGMLGSAALFHSLRQNQSVSL